MDSNPPTPHGALEYALYTLGGIIAVGATGFFSYLFGLKQNSANTHKTEAETRQIDANTESTKAETLQTQGEIMVALIKQSGIQALQAEQLRNERNHWERKAGEWEQRCEELTGELELLNLQLSKRISVNPDLPPFDGD